MDNTNANNDLDFHQGTALQTTQENAEYEDNLEYAHIDGQPDKPKISKTAQMKALMILISDKKERIKKILSKPATQRTPEELNEVASLLSVIINSLFNTTLQNVDFLKHFKDKLNYMLYSIILVLRLKKISKYSLLDLARYMTLETYLGKKTIVEQGSEGDKFYFILDGRVSIYIKSFNDMTGNEFFKHVVDLHPGAYFGELSLIYNAPRTATVTSLERCDLVVVSRFAYEKIIRDYHIDQMDKMITFYMNFPLFEDMNKELIFTIVTRSRYLKISTKETVVQQGDMPKMVYFIKSGKLKVVKEIKSYKNISLGNSAAQTGPSFNKTLGSPFSKKEQFRQTHSTLPKLKNKHFKGQEIHDQNSMLGTVQEEMGTQEQIQYLELDDLDSGDVFCHNNVMDKKPMDHSIISVLPSEIYTLPANDFLLLCKDLLQDFKRYNKPYPSQLQIQQLFAQEKKWVQYKDFLMKQIQVNKKLGKFSFDYILRQNDIKLPKAVFYKPESKIKLSQEKRRMPKEELHKKFMRTSESDDSSEDESQNVRKASFNQNPSKSQKVLFIDRDNQMQSQLDEATLKRRQKLLGQSTSQLFVMNSKINRIDNKIQDFNKMANIKTFNATQQLQKDKQLQLMHQNINHKIAAHKTPNLKQSFSQPRFRHTLQNINPFSPTNIGISTNTNFKRGGLGVALPSIDDIKTVVNSFNFLQSNEKKALNQNMQSSLQFTPALIESYNKYAPALKKLKIPKTSQQSPMKATLKLNSMSSLQIANIQEVKLE